MNPKQVREALRKGKKVRYVAGIAKKASDPLIVRVVYERWGRSRYLATYIDEHGGSHHSAFPFVRYFLYIAKEAPCTA